MAHFTNNPKWLLRFAPFRALPLSSAYLAPFFLERGLNLTEIFLLQTIFSVAVLLWELPSGYLADKLGRARCIKLSAPLAAIALIAYGFSGEFWQFVACELLLAISNGLISGADTALLYDSLKANGREQEYEKLSKRINARVFAAPVAGFPLAALMVWQIGIAPTIIVDGMLIAVGAFFAWKLAEAPRFSPSEEKAVKSAWHSLREMLGRAEVRWLLVLYAALSSATYLGFWLSAPTYQSLGIPVAAFAIILAVRNLWKASWSHGYHSIHRPGGHMLGYVILAVLGYVGMASGQWWWLWLVLGHDIVHALQGPAILQRLNNHMPNGSHRATVNSAVNLLQRLTYTIVGPVIGIAADIGGLTTGLLAAGTLCSGAAFFALARLHRLRTFRD
jgi:MFS family permease